MGKQPLLKYFTPAPVLRKQIRILKRRFHAASLRGSCGSPLGSTSNPWQTQELRKTGPRKPVGGRGQVKSQMFRKSLEFANKISPKLGTFWSAKEGLKTRNISEILAASIFSLSEAVICLSQRVSSTMHIYRSDILDLWIFTRILGQVFALGQNLLLTSIGHLANWLL